MKLKFFTADWLEQYLRWFPFIVATLVFVNTAWITEDIFITFRAVDNFLKGYGLVWNIGERVQVYTHPLWYFLLVLGIGIFKHHYWVTIALCYACLIGVVSLLLKIAKNLAVPAVHIALVFTVLLLSRSFVDYSSSGLENPLLHVLLLAYVCAAIQQKDAARIFFDTSLLYSLIFLTRPDAIFILAPASLWMLGQAKKQVGWRQTLILACIAALPAVVWEMFSLIYYGSFVPNTALAKVNIDYPQSVLFEQAKHYFVFIFSRDPITLGMIILSFFLVWLGKISLPKLLMAGVALQILYIYKVGADYMMGRFLSPSILLGAISILLFAPATERLRGLITYALATLVATSLFIQPMPMNLKYPQKFVSENIRWGMADERAIYYYHLGVASIFKNHRGNPYTHPWLSNKELMQNAGTRNIGIAIVIGMGAWASGEKPYWIDMYALANPYLARLPARTGARTGHYKRALPNGYLETLVTGKNMIAPPLLAALYDDVALATRGELWGWKRAKALWRLNIKYYKEVGLNFDRDDQASWPEIIPQEYLHDNYRSNFVQYLGGAPQAYPPGIALPLGVSAASKGGKQ